jgi:hypothetical protein
VSTSATGVTAGPLRGTRLQSRSPRSSTNRFVGPVHQNLHSSPRVVQFHRGLPIYTKSCQILTKTDNSVII